MPDLAVIVPTRGRPENIRRVIGAWDFTNAWDHADLILAVDADDPELMRYVHVFGTVDHGDIMQFPEWRPMVPKLDATALALADKYFALGFAGDDHLPQTINWAARYLTVLRELRTGMVYGDDGYQGRKLSTEWAVTSDVVRALGRMVPAPVEHMFCDNSILELFTLAGAVRHLPEVRIEHMHPYAGKAESDDQYKRVNGREQMHRDRVTYQRWRAKEAPAQVAAVRALRRGIPQDRLIHQSARTRQQGRTGMKPPRFFKRVQAATPEDIMMALADFATQVPADQEIVEIGVFHGRTALQLAWGARQGNRAHVTAIDPWDLAGNTYGPPFTDSGTRRWAYHHVKSLGYSRDITLVHAFSADAVLNYEGPPIGLLFIDGDHSEEGARRDVVDWAPYLAPDARIAIDDYGHPDWPGVKLAVDALVAEGVLDPIEIYHGALAVTRLARPDEVTWEETQEAAKRDRAAVPHGEKRAPTAITSEGVHPSPVPGACVEIPCPDFEDFLLGEGSQGSSIQCVHGSTECCSEKPGGDLDILGDYDRRQFVQEGEVDAQVSGQSIDDLNIAQLKALARHRGITLGARKDKRSEILQALYGGK